MTATSAVRAGRRAAETLMVDDCVVLRRGTETLDPATDLYVPNWQPIYIGPCRLKYQAASSRTRDHEGQLFALESLTLSLPYDTSDDVDVDDVVEITTQYVTARIAGRFAQTWATARRFPVETLS